MPKRILLTVSGVSVGCGDALTEDCECAVVEVDEELVEQIADRVELAKRCFGEDAECQGLQFTGAYDATYYDGAILTWLNEPEQSELMDEFENTGCCVLPDDLDLAAIGAEEQRVECNLLEIDVSRNLWDAAKNEWASDPEWRIYVQWSAMPKHCDFRVYTYSVPAFYFREVLEEQPTATV